VTGSHLLCNIRRHAASVAKGAEISAAIHKRGRQKLGGQEKYGAELLENLSKKGPLRGSTFELVWVFTKQSYFRQNIVQ
jgi:hypothetical protein